MRYYYTDALKAAWMAREYGVRFGFCDDGEFMEIDDLDCWFAEEPDGKYYIHPDSLAIFEPQVGDLVEHAIGNKWIDAGGYEVGVIIRYDSSNKEFLCENEYKIIQRNNTAFFMPEVEHE